MVKEKVKKPFYKKWWFWVIVVVLVIGVASGGSSNDETEDGEVEITETATSNDKEDKENNEEVLEKERLDAIKEFHDEIIPKLDKLSVNLEGTTPIEFANEHDMEETDKIIKEVSKMNDDYKEKTGSNKRDEMEPEERKADNKKVIKGKEETMNADELIFAYEDLSVSIEDIAEDYNSIKDEYSDDNFDRLENTFQYLEEDKQEFKNVINKLP